MKFCSLTILLVFNTGVSVQAQVVDRVANHPGVVDHMFIGEHIITMVDPDDAPGALAVIGDKIVWLGDSQDAQSMIGEETQVHRLGARALLPGFIDAHGHLTFQAATIYWANLASPPVGAVTDIESLQSTLGEYIADNKIPPGTWVIGNGYDDSLLNEQRHPNRDDLDQVSSVHPIALLHVSGHLMAANSLALAETGIDAEMADPPGGIIRRYPGSNRPDGVLEETATYPLRAVLQQPTGNPIEGVIEAMNLYASYGITTVQDGAITLPGAEMLEAMDEQGLLTLDVVVYPMVRDPNDNSLDDVNFGSYRDRFKYGGVKMSLDGSPQGKTAYLSAPYLVPPAGQDADYLGYPTLPAETVNTLVARYIALDVPILAHANGDAAGEMLINAVELATEDGNPRDHRTVMIHAQTVRDDQLDRMAQLQMIPSFFSAHVYYWGDWHRDSVLGEQRAARISPTRSALDRDIIFTLHNDSPIVPPDMLRLIWATTNRLTRSDQILGADQRLTTYEALAAVTRDAAYQYFESEVKGTLAVGKLADLVILSADPLEVPAADLQLLNVDETWSHGERVFAR